MKIRINEKINCSIIFTLLILRMYSGGAIFAILAFLFTIIGMLFTDNSGRPIYIFSLMQWQYVFKTEYNSFSMFTFITIIFVFIQGIFLFRKKVFNKKILLCILLLAIISVISIAASPSLEMSDILFAISWIMNFVAVLLISVSTNEGTDLKKYILCFVVSTIVCGIVGFIGRYLVNTFDFYNKYKSLPVNVNGLVLYRLTGVDIDPNFFSLQVLMSISLLVPLKIDNKKMKTISIFILIIFGILTISKMFILILLLVVAMFVFVKRNYIKNAFFNTKLKHIIVLSFVIIIITYSFPKIYNMYFSRLEEVDDMNALTSGRSEIWNNYTDKIMSDNKILLIGNGLSTNYLYGFSAHNGYLAGLYQIGVIGFIIFVLFYVVLVTNTYKEEKNEIFYKGHCLISLVVFLIASFSLDTFGVDYLPFLLYLTTKVLKYNK